MESLNDASEQDNESETRQDSEDQTRRLSECSDNYINTMMEDDTGSHDCEDSNGIWSHDCEERDGWADDSFCFGDGVGDETFEVIKSIIFDLIANTARLNGKVAKDAEYYLGCVLSVCSSQQRKLLMKTQNQKHVPLSLACEIGNINVVRFLVDHCYADVNEHFGWPLYWAVFRKREHIVRYLLERDADSGTQIACNYNILMTALGIEVSKCSEIIEEHRICIQHKQRSDGNRIDRYQLISDNALLPDHADNYNGEIVNLLIQFSAVEKSSVVSLYYILKDLLDKIKEDKNGIYFLKILKRIPVVDDIKTKDGRSFLEHVILQTKINLSAVVALIERGANINTVRTKDVIILPKSYYQFHNIQNCVDSVLELCQDGLFKSDDDSEKHFLHPILYAAHLGLVPLLINFLSLPQIPLRDKLDAVEVYGAFLIVRHDKFSEALFLWKIVTKFRMNSMESSYSLFLDDMSLDSVQNRQILYPLYKHYEECKPNNEIYRKHVISHERLAFIYNTEFQTLDDLARIKPDMTRDLLIQAALIYERVAGYGNSITCHVFERLAQRYMTLNELIPYMQLMLYCLPMFTRFLSPNIRLNNRCTYILGLMRTGLLHVLCKRKVREKLDFDTIMAIMKCLLLACFTVHYDFRFSKLTFSHFIIAIVKIEEHQKSPEEDAMFRSFLKKVIKLDLRDEFKQTFLHYAVVSRKLYHSDLWRSDQDNGDFSLPPKNWWINYYDEPLSPTQLLLECGADPNIHDAHGHTPLHAFYLSTNDGKKKLTLEHKNVLDLLLGADAHADFRDSEGKTPVEYSQLTCLPLCRVGNRSLQCLVSRYICLNSHRYLHQMSSLTKYMVQYIELHQKHGQLHYKPGTKKYLF
ncbi:FEM1B [Mytilus coruscus]|uniref:FEM1B n=1 Tax=Mytilus coruscus TaxID=42192 RepID=A0A6J8BST8_MYTCO|nr:FEM1B [Mytilus coruscus]